MTRTAPSGFQPLPPPSRRLRPADHLIRAAAATFLKQARDRWEPPEELSRALWPDDDETVRLIRAASSPASLDNPEWAGSYASAAVADFISSLPNSVFAELRRRSPLPGLVMPVAASLSVPSISDVPPALFIGERQPIPVVVGQLAAAKLGHKKVASIILYSKELAATPVNAEGLMRALLSSSITTGVDAVLLSTNAATPAAPAGIFHGLTPVAASADPDPAIAMHEDLAALVAELGADANVDSFVVIASTAQAMALRLAVPAGNLPVFSSPALASGTVALVDASGFASVAGSGVAFDLSESAMVSARTDPAVDPMTATPVFSAWQSALISIRAVLDLDWGLTRADAVALVTGVNW